jgi:hypothetical protein
MPQATRRWISDKVKSLRESDLSTTPESRTVSRFTDALLAYSCSSLGGTL